MEDLLQAVGSVIFVILAIVGLTAGLIAGGLTGRNKIAFAVLGVLGAIVTPVILAVLGIGVLAAGGVLAVLLVGLVGAILLVVIGKMIFD